MAMPSMADEAGIAIVVDPRSGTSLTQPRNHESTKSSLGFWFVFPWFRGLFRVFVAIFMPLE